LTNAARELRDKLLLETIAKGLNVDPKVYLQGLLNSPGSTKHEKLRAAELLLRYPPEPPPYRNSNGGCLTIYSLPRGSSVDLTTGEIIIPEGAELVPVVPYSGTPSLPRDDGRRGPEREHERLEVTEAFDDTKVATLHPSYGRTFASGRRLTRGRLPDDDDSAA
jgi:hypothetical protein